MDVKQGTVTSSIVFPVTSGEESQDTVIDLSLSMIADMDSETESTQIPLAQAIETISTNQSWTMFREEHGMENEVINSDGWISPVNLRQILDDELRNSQNERSLETGASENQIDPITLNSLQLAIETFKDNSEVFKEYLKTLREEVQTMPLFQGAINSLSRSVVSNSGDLKELKLEYSNSLATITESQNQLRSFVEKQLGTNSSEVSISELRNEASEILATMKIQNDLILKIESYVQSIDMQKLHGNLETIYQAVKKSIDENKEAFRKLSIISEIPSEEGQKNLDEDVIANISRLTNQLDNIVHQVGRVNVSLLSLKKKQTATLIFTCLGMGALLSGMMHLLSKSLW